MRHPKTSQLVDRLLQNPNVAESEAGTSWSWSGKNDAQKRRKMLKSLPADERSELSKRSSTDGSASSTSALEQSKGFEKDPEVRRAIQKLLSKLDQARETSQNVENDPGVRYATSALLDKIAQAQEMDQSESSA